MDTHNDLEKPEESAYLNCIRCGLCLAVCPPYREYLKETASPRGRVALARKGLEGQLELSPNLIEQMYGCFACMACNDICPVGIHPADLALSMRHVQEQIKPAPWKGTLFAGLIPHPDRMEAATLPLRLYQMLGIRRLVYALGLMRLMPRQLRDLEAMLPYLPQQPLRHVLPEVTEARKPAQYRVGFFLGCAQNLLFAEESAATVRVLARIVICLTRMNHILEIDTENATVRAEAGVVTSDLQAEVEKRGLFYPPDPSSIRHSTIGGNIACNAGGPRCLKYGVTGDYVLGLTVVLADGGILKTGGKPIKDVTGYDLNGLFTGSEGTLGLITEALLRLVAKPRYARTALAEFASLADASRTVNAILTAGIVPATLELMDQTALVCIEEAMHLGLRTDVEASLIIETDGADEETVLREIEASARICQETGARSVKMAQNEAERSSLWKARRSISPSLARKAPNKLGEDITVPRSAIPQVVQQLRAISAKYGLPIVIFGHAGDGNLHPNILFDKRQPEQWAKVEQMVAEIFDASLALGGTLSGEHGVGVLKRPYLERALGPLSVGIQRSIKQALDPMNILNPGKMFLA